jgi:antirestriction protein ArdC
VAFSIAVTPLSKNDAGKKFRILKKGAIEMKTKDVYQTVTNNILAAMEKGIIPWRNPFKSTFSPMPVNFSTRKAYRGINVFLLNMACYQFGYPINNWLTFNQARDLGGKVKKGQKSEMVLFWKPTLIREQSVSEDGELVEISKEIYIARIYHVFNIEQCEGIKNEAIDQSSFPRIESCEQIYANYPDIKPEINLGLGAMYIPKLDQIRIPTMQDFISTSDYYATLFHELVHSTGHITRLNREGIAAAQRSDLIRYSMEELIAEMGASFLCALIGIENTQLTENAAAYIQNWLEVFKQDKTMVVKAASQAQVAVDFITNKR